MIDNKKMPGSMDIMLDILRVLVDRLSVEDLDDSDFIQLRDLCHQLDHPVPTREWCSTCEGPSKKAHPWKLLPADFR